MNDIYKNIEEYNTNKKRKTLIVFDYMIADMLTSKKLIRGGKLNISLAFTTQFYFSLSKNIRLNTNHYFLMKIPSKRVLQETAFNHSSDIDFFKMHCKTIFIFSD